MKAFILLLLSSLFIQLSAQTHEWVNSFGSSGSERNHGITITPDNNLLSIGYFTGTVDFDPSSGISNSTSNGSRDIVICSYNQSGSFLWKKTIGGTGEDFGVSITTDTIGNIYTTGGFSNTCDFDPSSLVFNLSSNGNKDIYINKLDSAGNLIWAKSFGGSGEDRGISIKVTTNQEVIVTGFFRGTVDFDPGTGTTNKTSGGGEDGFICKLDSAGNFLWVNTYGGSTSNTLRERGRSVEVDAFGNTYLCGHFVGTVDFDPGTGISNLTSNGSIDGFVTKLDSNGALIWAKSWGGSGEDYTTAFIRTDSNNFYITGLFEGTSDFDPSSVTENRSSKGSFDPYILKLDQSGIFKWVKTIGSPFYDVAASITVDQHENVIFSGFFNNTMDCDPDTSVYNIVSAGPNNGYTCKFKSNGEFDWAFPIKSSPVNSSTDNVISNKNGLVYMVGSFSGSNIDFDPQTTTASLSSNGNIDAYIHKIIDCSPIFDTLFELACNTYTSPSGNFTWTSNGTYKDTLISALGCDSILIINLFITTSRDTLNPISCSTFTSPSGNYRWDSTGTYFDTIPGGINCDSLLLINLTVFKIDTSFTEIACKNYISPSGKMDWISSGVYNDTLSSTQGCDSIMTITLNLIKPDTSVNISSLTLSSNDTGLVVYQWLDCQNGFSRITGATSRSFTANYSSSFSVEINNANCIDTTLCYSVLVTGINAERNINSSISVFPNPSKEFFHIETIENKVGKYTLFGLSGNFILRGTINSNKTKVNTKDLQKGIYFLEIALEDNSRITKKIVLK